MAIAEMVGGVLVCWIVNVKAELALLVPSLTEIVICALPLFPAAGVIVTVRFWPLPPNTMFAVGASVGLDEADERARLDAGVSASPIVNGIAAVVWFIMPVWGEMAEMVGGAFGAWTVNRNPELTMLVPSLTEIVICALPAFPVAGVTVTVRFWPLPPNTILPVGTKVVFPDTAESARLDAAVSGSLIVKEMGPAAWFSSTVWSAMEEIVGGEFGAACCTVKVKLELALLVPSLTEIVICAVPVWPAAGVTVTVRFWPVPLNTMFAFGTSVVTDETADNARLEAGVCESLMVNGIAVVDWPMAVTWF